MRRQGRNFCLKWMSRREAGLVCSVLEPDSVGYFALQWCALNNRTTAAQYLIELWGNVERRCPRLFSSSHPSRNSKSLHSFCKQGFRPRSDLPLSQSSMLIGAVSSAEKQDKLLLTMGAAADVLISHTPLQAYYHSGGLRLNLNLYENGKVCLTLLNTRTGKGTEVSDPQESSIFQVLVSIQGLVLNTKHYFNEAGYDRQFGTLEGEKNSLFYNENSFLLSCKSMLYLIRRPPMVLNIVNSNSKGAEDLSRNTDEKSVASSSWSQEDGRFATRKSESVQDGENNNAESDSNKTWSGLIKQVVPGKDDGAVKSDSSGTEVVNIERSWKRDPDDENSDALVRLMRDQLIMARAYANIAHGQVHYDLVRDLKIRIKEHTSIVGDANLDAELPAGAEEKMKVMSELLGEARDKHYDNSIMVKKLRAMV